MCTQLPLRPSLSLSLSLLTALIATTTRAYAMLRHTAADRVVPPFGQQDGGDAAPAPASFPDKVGDVDCEFLSRVLGAKVKAFKVEPLGLVRHTTHTHNTPSLSSRFLISVAPPAGTIELCSAGLHVFVCVFVYVCVRARTRVCARMCVTSVTVHQNREAQFCVLCFVLVCATVVKGFDAPRARICVGT
jgi:hypothetical protein